MVTLAGGCTSESGSALEGSISIHRAPDGGTWIYQGWTEQRGASHANWSGNLAWIQTDGANQLTAYEFVATEPSIGLSGTYPSAAFVLDSAGRAISADGAASLDILGANLPLILGGEWDFADCAANPMNGFASWQGGERILTAQFDNSECGGCIPWESADETGSWCAVDTR